jgi:hypothetical protein
MNGKAFFPLGPTRANSQPLKASDKKDHLRVDVSGEVKGDTLEVTSVKLL